MIRINNIDLVGGAIIFLLVIFHNRVFNFLTWILKEQRTIMDIATIILAVFIFYMVVHFLKKIAETTQQLSGGN